VWAKARGGSSPLIRTHTNYRENGRRRASVVRTQSATAVFYNFDCDHKDCGRTDATPVVFTHRNRDGELVGKFTYCFCPEHREQLFSLKETRTLPPEEWFEEANG
jgi:hypothetical protein